MKKSFSSILLKILFIQIIFFQGIFDQTHALTQSYNFDNSSEYTISDTGAAYIHGGAAKLKGALQAHGALENGPTALQAATNIIYDESGKVAYVASSGGHAITSLDVSDPENIQPLGYIGGDTNNRFYAPYDIKKQGDFLYVASDIGDSLQIIDVSDPADLKFISKITNTASIKMNGVRGIDIIGNYAYLTAYHDDALQIVDISDPSSPIARGYIQDTSRLNGAQSVDVVGNYAYVTGYLSDTINVIDISDPDFPFIVSSLGDDTITELNGAWDIEVVGNYAYVTAFIDDGLEIIDISDPTNLQHLGEIQNTDPGVFLNGARTLKIEGDFAYISASVDDSLEIVNISDPKNPVHVGVLDTTSFAELDGTFGLDVFGEIVLMTSFNNGSVFSIDVSNPASPSFLGEIYSGPANLGNPVSVIVEGNYAYVTSFRGHGLEIIDISDSANPIHVSFIGDISTQNELFGAWDLIKNGDYIYVSSNSDSGIEIIDVSNPHIPVSVGRVLDSPTIELQAARGSDIEGNYLYVTGYTGDTLQILDISDPANPIALGNIKDSSLLNAANDVQVVGNYAYVTAYLNDSIAVIDVSDPNNPIFIRELKDATGLELNGVWDLDVSHDEKYLYIASLIDDAVVVIDISVPGNPTYAGDLDDDASNRLNGARGITYDEGYAYIASYNDDSIAVVDVSDPSNPLYIDELRDTVNYDTTNKLKKQGNDIFSTQYLGSSFSVTREVYPDTIPFITPNIPVLSDALQSINITEGEFNDGEVTLQLSKDNGATWYYFDGSSWSTTTAGYTESNSTADINTNITEFNSISGTGEIVWKAFMRSKGPEKVEIDEIILETLDITPPVITDSFPSENNLLPRHNFDITFEYNDGTGGVGIDTDIESTDFTNNIAPNANITHTPTGFTPHLAPDSIVNGIISTTGTLDYEYHSNSTNAFIEFEWDTPQKVGDMKIYNRVGCCAGRLSNATIRLYDENNTLIYTHTLSSTDGVNIIDIDFQALGEIHEVKRLRIDSVGADSFINIREIEIFPIEENIELFKWDGTSYGNNIAHEHINFSHSSFGTGSANYQTIGLTFGKYKMDFKISDSNGNTAAESTEFYIDEPELIVGSGSIDLGTINHLTNTFSQTVDIEVLTVGASFELMFSNTTLLNYQTVSISPWNGTVGFGFRSTPFIGPIQQISADKLIGSEPRLINTNGNKNSYIYQIQLGALIEEFQAGGDYIGDLKFDINLQY